MSPALCCAVLGLLLQGVELSPTDDPNIIFDRHQRNGCDPANYARVHKKPRCPARGCKEKLTTINTYTCKDCKAAVCLRHRLAQDHQCAGPSAASAAAAAAGGWVWRGACVYFGGWGDVGGVLLVLVLEARTSTQGSEHCTTAFRVCGGLQEQFACGTGWRRTTCVLDPQQLRQLLQQLVGGRGGLHAYAIGRCFLAVTPIWGLCCRCACTCPRRLSTCCGIAVVWSAMRHT